MHFALTPNQRHFFEKNQFIEFEGLLLEHASCVKEEAETLLAKRLSALQTKAPAAYFQAGYDLWRESSLIRKATQKLSIAKIAADLFDAPVLRIAYDQFYTSHLPFSQPLSLKEISSVKPLAGAIFFTLEETPDMPSPFPQKLGNALFVSPEFLLPFSAFTSLKSLNLLCLAFAKEKSFYSPAPQDPHAQLLKKMGYAYNAFLKDDTHPILSGKK
jgi:hypothetical protein